MHEIHQVTKRQQQYSNPECIDVCDAFLLYCRPSI